MGHVLSYAAAGRRRFNYRIAAEGVALSVVFWGVVVAAALISPHTHWPQASPALPKGLVPGFAGRPAISHFEAWENLVTLWCVVEFLVFFKAWAMIRRQTWDRHNIDWLTVSLILPNLLFGFIYFYSIGGVLFGWQTTAMTRRFLLRDPLILSLVFGAIQLCRVPDHPMEEGQRENVEAQATKAVEIVAETVTVTANAVNGEKE